MREGGSRRQFESDFDVSRETMGRLDRYEALLLKWQRSHNLVGTSTLPDVWSRHFADSAQILTIYPEARAWADLGSGAGFPGLVLAILLAEEAGAEVHLIEVDQRKCAFLREVIRETGAPARVHNGRVEDVLPSLKVEVATSRALADLKRLVGWTLPIIQSGGRAIFLKGRGVARELTEIAAIPNIQVDLLQSRTNSASHIVLVRRSIEHEPIP